LQSNFNAAENIIRAFHVTKKQLITPTIWPKAEFDVKDIICEVCGIELIITDYQNSNNICPNCKSAFNPGCSKHYHLCFQTDSSKK
jgi:uncharacterized CHY-type Zn-finger protein